MIFTLCLGNNFLASICHSHREKESEMTHNLCIHNHKINLILFADWMKWKSWISINLWLDAAAAAASVGSENLRREKLIFCFNILCDIWDYSEERGMNIYIFPVEAAMRKTFPKWAASWRQIKVLFPSLLNLWESFIISITVMMLPTPPFLWVCMCLST